MKKCSACQRFKVAQDFYGGRPDCKSCVKARSKADYEKNRPARKAKMRQYNLRHNYDLSVDEANDLLSTGCLICGSMEKLRIDHNHETGQVRGCLCDRHNLALGLFHDDVEELAQAIAYLSR